MKHAILAVTLAACRTVAPAPVSGVGAIPGLGASLAAAAPLSAPALTPFLPLLATPALTPAPALAPAPLRAVPVTQERAVAALLARMPKAVLFDWDDTLADERPVVRATHEELFRRFGFEMPSHEELENQWRADHAVFYARFFPGVPTESVEDVWHEITQRLRRGEEINGRRVERGALFAGAADILEALTTLGVPVAVVSNKREEALLREIEAAGLSRYFKHVRGHKDGRLRKPSPESITATLEALGVAPGDAWYVGDQLSDMEAARGMPRILIGAEPARMARERGMHEDPAGGVVFLDALRELLPLLQTLPKERPNQDHE